MHEHENEDWFQLYREAVLELEHVKMTGRIRDARAGIDVRIEALRHVPGLHDEENVAILDALNVLRTLEREEQRLAEEEKKRLAAEALQKIEPLSAFAAIVLSCLKFLSARSNAASSRYSSRNRPWTLTRDIQSY